MEQTLLKKIDNLFRFRGIPQMLALAGGHMDDAFGQNMIRLQVSIYALDKYLETTWDTRKSDLKLYWRDINDCLRVFGLKRTEIPQWRKRIEEYQAHELELRDGRLPLRRALRTTYTAKSCDVWLMRKLIFREYPGLIKQYRLSDWKYYDLITEVHDDIEDVFEDTDGYNGNRFLLTIISKGKRAAQKEYDSFLHQVREESRRHFNNRSGGKTAFVEAWTNKRADQTERLLRRRLGQKKLGTISSAALIGRLGLDV